MKNNSPNSSANVKSVNLSSEIIKEGIADALTAFVGGGQKYPVQKLAGDLGKQKSTIYSYRSGEIPVPSVELMMCMHILPVDFANRVMALIGLNGLHRSDANSSNILELGGGLAQLSAAISYDASDGRIDHIEAAKLAPEFRLKATRLSEKADELDAVAASGGSLPVVGGR